MPISVLLVSNNLLTLEVVTYKLEIEGHFVVPVSSADIAYSCFDSIIFDVVVVEASLDGARITNVAYDAKTYQSSIKVILIGGQLSSASTGFFIDRAIRAPYRLEELVEMIEQLAARRTATHDHAAPET